MPDEAAMTLKVAACWSAVPGRPLGKGSSEVFATIGGGDAGRQEPAGRAG